MLIHLLVLNKFDSSARSGSNLSMLIHLLVLDHSMELQFINTGWMCDRQRQPHNTLPPPQLLEGARRSPRVLSDSHSGVLGLSIVCSFFLSLYVSPLAFWALPTLSQRTGATLATLLAGLILASASLPLAPCHCTNVHRLR